LAHHIETSRRISHPKLLAKPTEALRKYLKFQDESQSLDVHLGSFVLLPMAMGCMFEIVIQEVRSCLKEIRQARAKTQNGMEVAYT
jgi:hypothetical protein